MRKSSVLFFGALLGVAALPACRLSTTDDSATVALQTEFTDKTQPAKTSSADWNGEEISIANDGVGIVYGEGGVQITVDPNATKITASAIFAAFGDGDNKKADADASILDAIQAFKITEETGKFSVTCGHGGNHGTSAGATSGCKLLKVTIPAGSADKPLKLKVGDGNGGIVFSGPVTATSLLVDENGQGDVDVKVNPVAGADKIIVTGEHAVSVALPADFSANTVTLTVNETDVEIARKRFILTDFPGMANAKPYPASGAAVDALNTLNVWSKGLDELDTVTIKKL